LISVEVINIGHQEPENNKWRNTMLYQHNEKSKNDYESTINALQKAGFDLDNNDYTAVKNMTRDSTLDDRKLVFMVDGKSPIKEMTIIYLSMDKKLYTKTSPCLKTMARYVIALDVDNANRQREREMNLEESENGEPEFYIKPSVETIAQIVESLYKRRKITDTTPTPDP
jgi:hypothetical protein